MGKAGRVACIFVPWAATIVSLALLIIVELGGANNSSLLNSVYAWQADFSKLTIPSNPNQIGQALQRAQNSGKLDHIYQIHLYNYCSSNATSNTISFCSDRSTNFVFDFINTWDLNDTSTTTKRQSPVSSPANSVSNAANNVENQIKALFGQSVVDSLNAYLTASKWMDIAFQVALWTSVATAVAGILAVFSRWGSFITWILSFVSSLFSFGAAVTATVIFGTLVGTFKAVLDPYKVTFDLGGTFLAYLWISVLLSIGATSFWLFSVCCCSGKSNPHHRSNRGGLWHAEPKNGYGGGRGMRVEQTGGYQRVSSPYMGAGDRVPLHDYPAPMPVGGAPHHNASFEPYRQY